ncbi:hypothetical protein [Dyella terrae]|uniref:hypothetical protein n=1 Tax=Dyella terrae TaxID=522259 RepID=UPI001EFE5C42|nr:hypothetical protein [Dyella terrae]ULU27683.1 hypothetical protein DYST_04649 [Dyella terrae]
MASTRHDDTPKTMDEIREEFRQYLKSYPDFDDLIATGMLRPIGGGWYEPGGGRLQDGLGKYMNVRVRSGKAQYKPIKLTKDLKALKDSL